MPHFDLSGIFYLAMIGLIALGVFVVWLLWFVVNHVRFV